MPFGLFGGDASTRDQDLAALADAIDGQGLFRDVPASKLKKLVPLMRVKSFEDEEIVCNCEDADHDAFVLLSGGAAVTKNLQERQYVLQLKSKGALFNAGPLVGAEAAHRGARALGKVSLVAMDNDALRKLSAEDPELGYPIGWNLCRLSIDQHERQIEHHLAVSPQVAL